MFSIAVGPVMGGALSHRWGFRSIFDTLAVLSGLVLIQIIVLLPETLRCMAGNGSVRVSGIKYKPLWNVMSKKLSDLTDPEEVAKPEIKLGDFLEPFHMLGEMDTLLNLLFGGVVYSMWSMMTGTTTMLLAERFDLNELHIGFAYLPNGESGNNSRTISQVNADAVIVTGIGTCVGSALAGWLMDRDYKSTEAIYKDTHGMSEDCNI